MAVGLIALTVVLIILMPKLIEKERERRRLVEEEYEKEPEYEFVQARVLSKRCSNYYQPELRMPMLPAQKSESFVTFLREDGSEVEYAVRQEVFESIEENQEGTLVTVNGNFFDFGDGEEIPLEMAEELQAVEEIEE